MNEIVQQPSPLPNDPASRNPDGSLKDQAIPPKDGETPKPIDQQKSGSDEGEKKPADEKKPETPAVPDKYEFKLPEGFELKAETNTEVQELFKGLGLSQESAQKLVDFHAKEVKAVADAGASAVEAMRTEWRNTTVKDPVLGDGKGLKGEVAATIAKGIDALGPDIAKGFRQAMDETGMGDHPAIIKAIHVFAQRVTEGTHVAGKGPSESKAPNAPTSAASAMYPNLPSAAR